jgi:hypothetical protein
LLFMIKIPALTGTRNVKIHVPTSILDRPSQRPYIGVFTEQGLGHSLRIVTTISYCMQIIFTAIVIVHNFILL